MFDICNNSDQKHKIWKIIKETIRFGQIII